MKCVSCNHKMKKERKDYHYIESGLNNIYLKNLDILKCSDCGDEEIVIPKMQQLHNLISNIIASQKQKLLPGEIRFLRVHLGFSGVQFAEKFGVTPETVSRWEKGTVRMKTAVENLLRVLILSGQGPFRNYDNLSFFGSIERKTPEKKLLHLKKDTWKEAA